MFRSLTAHENLKCLRLAVENAKSYLDLAALALTHRTDSGIFNCADVPTKNRSASLSASTAILRE